jgi:L-histidine Nalpha-methyltransferase
MLADVGASLARRPRELSPKYFYDARGSRLFEKITRLPEYYLTRAEREILVAHANDIVESVSPRSVVELGAGSAAKTRLLLDAASHGEGRITYAPVDVSAEFLAQTRAALEREYDRVRVMPVVADISESLALPPGLDAPVLFLFLGSTIGNFTTHEAIELLRRVRHAMQPGDALVLGTDLRKDPAVIEAAYNDVAGVTAEFNRNVLLVMNEELGADFDPDAFEHEARYDEREHRIEMYLRATRAQRVCIPGLPMLRLERGEMIRTELSHKYDRASVDALAASAALQVQRWYTDHEARFALSVLGARE